MKGVTRQTGIISDIDEAVVRVRVTLPECDNLRSNWLAVLQRNTQDNKDYWLPDIAYMYIGKLTLFFTLTSPCLHKICCSGMILSVLSGRLR